MGQIDERYIAEALEPMHQESAGTSDENKAAMPKKGKLFFYRQRRTVAAAAALVICIGAAGIAQWRLHSEEPGPEMAAYDMAELSEEDGIAPQAEDAAADTPDAGENQGAAADRNAAQGRMVNNAEICFAEIYLEVAKGYVNDIVPRYKDSFWNTKDMIPGEQAIIRVSDTGIGMEKAVLPTIFKRFHQVQNNTGKQHTGSGIGLSLVKSLIELHHGGIIISSKPDAGTEVIIALPISDTYLAKEEKIEESTFVLKDYLSNYAVEYEPLEIEETTAIYMEGKPTILLVDDNHEILMILREYFVKDYNIIMAIDGQEALDKCNRSLPDIIISDVMMPRMNGIELCATLKKNLQTCFIPIILLTAKSQVEDQIEGIEMGADAYIPKPFNPRLLKANVRNLLNKSHQMRNLPTANNVRQEIQDKKQREVFGKLVELVNANLTDQQFSVDHLCLELGMNRTKLYSFIKSTTGMSLGNYIRKIRLDKAAELLRTTDMSISEVGYAVGIESPSYFTRTFKEQFGSSPSEFIKH